MQRQMKKTSESVALIYDYGTLVSLALRLSKDFKKVYYFNPYKKDYNKSSELQVGDGFDEIEWVMNFWDVYDKIDLFIFPQILDGDLQEKIVKDGKLAWGSREAERMEIDRWGFIEYMKKLGMPVPESKLIKGIDALRTELYKDDKEKWVKLDSNERGNIETFRYIEPEATELSILLPLEKDLGSYRDEIQFIVQAPVEAITETGYDGFVIDGKFPETALLGIEVKDMGYIGGVRAYKDLPEGVRYVNEKLAPALKAYGMRGNISTEIRETADGKHYMIDPTMRFPYPPSNIMMEMWENMAECIYKGAAGTLVEPIYKALFGVEVIMYSDYAKEEHYKLIVPDAIREFVKQPYAYKSRKTGSIIVVPQSTANTNVGSVIAYADTLEAAIDLVKERADQIKGHGLKIDMGCLDEAIEQFKKL